MNFNEYREAAQEKFPDASLNDIVNGFKNDYPEAMSGGSSDEEERSWGEFAGDVGLGLTKSATSFAGSLYGLGDLQTGGTLDEVVGLGDNFGEANRILTGMESDSLQASRNAFNKADGFFGSAGVLLSRPDLLLQMGLESSAYFLGASAGAKVGQKIATYFTKIPKGLSKSLSDRLKSEAGKKGATVGSVAAVAGMESGSAYQEIKQEVLNTDPNQLLKTSPAMQHLVNVEGITDLIKARKQVAESAGRTAAAIVVPGAILGGAIGSRLNTALATGKGAPKTLKEGLKVGVLGEAAEEGIQSFGGTLGSNVAKQKYLDESVGVFDNMDKNLAAGIITGGAMGGTIGGTMGALNRNVDSADIINEQYLSNAQREQTELDNITGAFDRGQAEIEAINQETLKNQKIPQVQTSVPPIMDIDRAMPDDYTPTVESPNTARGRNLSGQALIDYYESRGMEVPQDTADVDTMLPDGVTDSLDMTTSNREKSDPQIVEVKDLIRKAKLDVERATTRASRRKAEQRVNELEDELIPLLRKSVDGISSDVGMPMDLDEFGNPIDNDIESIISTPIDDELGMPEVYEKAPTVDQVAIPKKLVSDPTKTNKENLNAIISKAKKSPNTKVTPQKDGSVDIVVGKDKLNIKEDELTTIVNGNTSTSTFNPDSTPDTDSIVKQVSNLKDQLTSGQITTRLQLNEVDKRVSDALAKEWGVSNGINPFKAKVKSIKKEEDTKRRADEYKAETKDDPMAILNRATIAAKEPTSSVDTPTKILDTNTKVYYSEMVKTKIPLSKAVDLLIKRKEEAIDYKACLLGV